MSSFEQLSTPSQQVAATITGRIHTHLLASNVGLHTYTHINILYAPANL